MKDNVLHRSAVREVQVTVYAVAQITITDAYRYGRYQSRFREVFNGFRGRLLAADSQPAVIEGAWEHEKLILLQFSDEAAFREWMLSTEYQEIAQDRNAGSRGVVLLVQGIQLSIEAKSSRRSHTTNRARDDRL